MPKITDPQRDLFKRALREAGISVEAQRRMLLAYDTDGREGGFSEGDWNRVAHAIGRLAGQSPSPDLYAIGLLHPEDN